MNKHMSFTSFVRQLQENAKSEMVKGTKREMEHTDSPKVAAKIAKDHVKERPDYYSKLDKCMPEETQIDEISYNKAWKYIHKADDQMKDLAKKSVYGDATKHDYKTIAKRAKGLSMAKDAARRGETSKRKAEKAAAIEKHGSEHGIHKTDAFRMRHYPGKTDAELQKVKDEVKAHNKTNPDNKKRVKLFGRMGKDNPNAPKYAGRGHKHQYIKKGDAAYHDVYVNNRYEEVEIEEAAWADKAAERMGKYHAQSGTTHNLNKATRMFGDDGAKKYDASYRDEKKFAKGNKYLKLAMDKRDAKISGNMTWDRVKNEETGVNEGGFMTVGHKVNVTNPKATPRYTITSIGKGRDGKVGLERDGEHRGEFPKSRIIKTNRAAYALKAKQFKGFSEETEVNELSNDKLKSYVSRVKDRDEDKGIYSDDEKTYEKRRVGLAKARKRGVKEETVNEISKGLATHAKEVALKKSNDASIKADKLFKHSDWKRSHKPGMEQRLKDSNAERRVSDKRLVQAMKFKNYAVTKEETIEEGDGFSRKFATAMWKQKGALKKALKSIKQRNNIDKDSGATYRKYALGARKALGPKKNED